jgi:Lrp/AsnC family leucine-responsive transcriptional regulator
LPVSRERIRSGTFPALAAGLNPAERRHRPWNRHVKTLDAIDGKLIALLQGNARMPVAALAREVGLSRTAVQERLARLETSGAIAGYTLRLGRPEGRLQAWLSLRHAEGFTCDDVMPLLQSLAEVRLCHSLAGDLDLLVLVETDSPEALAGLRERILLHRTVEGVETRVVLRALLDRR